MQAVVFDDESVRYGIKGDLEHVDLVASKKFGDGTVIFPKETLALIKPMRVGVCGTDLAILDGHHGSAPPVILGHEIVGVVESIGDLVTHVNVGDRVAIDPNVACGVCSECRRCAKNRCLDLTTAGIFFDGGMARTMAVPASQLIVLPPELDWDTAALFEPLSCVMHGIAQMPRPILGSVLVFGGGPIGLLWALALKASGAETVTLVELSLDRRRYAAMEMGIDTVIPPEGLDVIVNPEHDVVVDATGHPSVALQLIRYARPGGQVNLFGQQHAGATVDAFPIVEANQKELTIVGSYATAYEYEETISMLRRNLPWQNLISHRFALENAVEAFDRMREGTCMKALILPNGEEA